MNVRQWLSTLVLAGPAIALIAFGPRGEVNVPQQRTLVRYWEKWSGVEAVAMRQIVDDFNATIGAEKNIWVDYSSVSGIEQRFLIATAGGDPPDLAGLYDMVLPQCADQDALLPLDDLAREFGIDADAFNAVWWNIGKYKGQLYALPSTPYTIALYYNREAFREVGLDPDRPPHTTAELHEFALRLNKYDDAGRLTRVGFSAPMLSWWPWAWPYYFDARLWDGREFRFDTPAVHECLDWLMATRTQTGLDQLLAFESDSGLIEGAQNPFLSGRVAMIFQGPWMSTWAKVYTPDLDYGVAPFPSSRANRHNVFASSDVFVIPRGSPHPREAMLFLSYVLRQPVFERLCRQHNKLSPYREPLPEFFEKHPNPFIRVFDRMSRSPHTFGYPKMPTFAAARDEIIVHLDQVLRGKLAPADAIDRVQHRVDAMVDRYQQMQARRGEKPLED